MDRGEGGEKEGGEEGAINFATDEGHKGARGASEVLGAVSPVMFICYVSTLVQIKRRHKCFSKNNCKFLSGG